MRIDPIADRARDIVEIDIGAFGEGGGERVGKIARLVTNAPALPEGSGPGPDLAGPSGIADGAASQYLADLADRRPAGPRRGRTKRGAPSGKREDTTTEPTPQMRTPIPSSGW